MASQTASLLQQEGQMIYTSLITVLKSDGVSPQLVKMIDIVLDIFYTEGFEMGKARTVQTVKDVVEDLRKKYNLPTDKVM